MSDIPVINLTLKSGMHSIHMILKKYFHWQRKIPSGRLPAGRSSGRRYLAWFFEGIRDFKLRETGIGMVAKDRRGAFEYVVAGTVDKKHVEFPGYSTYELDEADKLKSKKIVFDRLGLAEMVADDIVSKKVVHTVAKKVQEGLD